MGVRGGEQTSGQDFHLMAVGGGITAIGGDELQPKNCEFYHYGRVETLVCGGGVCTAQQPANCVTGGIIPGTMTGVDGYPPCGKPQRPDRATVGSAGGGSGDQHLSTRTGGPGTTLNYLAVMPRNGGVYVEDVAGGASCHGTGRLNTWIGPERFR